MYRPAELTERERAALYMGLHTRRRKSFEELLQGELPRWETHGAGSETKDLAKSEQNKLLKAWLGTDRGKEWAAQRKKLFEEPEGPAAADEEEA